MSMSTYVVGFAPVDERWSAMKAVWDACTKAGVDVPSDVMKFFDYESPDESGVKVDLTSSNASHGKAPVCTVYRADMHEGFEIDLAALKKHYPQVTRIRFYNAY